ncbi:UDP-N-acetylglucosamine--LPS N-acetylglucosamine transferase [Komarekiella sp. 'clone 1']|uniref:UDP-N-acetylglucosamine--LPS N-acetylglucosamine transferase n=1 Tax=Komarekiella delphini-convector SJRDD-AB1 TaxID=2593771 RepID=A0AA40T315_9NOST|nr:glycosyltransferase [Komarekiella delphini-convector]MBD6619775.1 UDP-N-acetylglucosamine--LPS N-acetylglucosamine transferase [Komarekiella delphini-convector SJRDD-AB1]
MKKIDLVFVDAGGGHRSTANALYQVIKKYQPSLEPRLFNLEETEIVESMDIFKSITGILGTDFYNLMLKKGWTRFEALYLTLAKFSIRRQHSTGLRLLEKYWLERRPDLVVSCIPLLNRVLRESLKNTIPDKPFVTMITDFADCPPNYWIEPQQQFLVCPTKRAFTQAQSLGHPQDKIFRTSGLVINPRFYEPIGSDDRQIERQRLGLEPDLPTGFVMFGGQGSEVMIKIAECLQRSHLNIQLIFICGHNQKLASTLCLSQSRLPRFVETFTTQIPYYMHLSDFFIGKPGPGSISEALAMNLPVITECNASTLVQERYNAEWIVNNQVGIVVDNFRHIDKAVAKIIQPENLAYYRGNAALLNNKAVFEVVDIFNGILEPTFS